MINRLINMDVNINPNTIEEIKSVDGSIQDYAIAFLKGMSETQRNRF